MNLTAKVKKKVIHLGWGTFVLCGIFNFYLSERLRAEDNSYFSDSENCALYLVKETFMFFFDYEIIGKTCSINAQSFISNDHDSLKIVIDIPIETIRSEDEEVDREVLRLLRADAHPSIKFHTQGNPLSELKANIEKRKGSFKGLLNISGVDYPVTGDFTVQTSPLSQNEFQISGKVVNKLSYFKIEPPSYVWGLYSYIEDYIEIHFQLQSNNIENLSKLLN